MEELCRVGGAERFNFVDFLLSFFVERVGYDTCERECVCACVLCEDER